MTDAFPENIVAALNAGLGGYNRGMGLRFIEAAPEEMVAELEVGEQHLQPYGIVHGGVYAGMVESVCSTGAALNVIAQGMATVGLDNTTTFLRPTRAGTLRCKAVPLSRGRRTHVWAAQIHNEAGRLVADGRVRLLVISREEAQGKG